MFYEPLAALPLPYDGQPLPYPHSVTSSILRQIPGSLILGRIFSHSLDDLNHIKSPSEYRVILLGWSSQFSGPGL
jgi:hypothetical protein